MDVAKQQIQDRSVDEINLIALLSQLWDSRWKIFGLTAFCVMLGVAYLFVRPHNFQATTEFKPLSSLASERYRASNAAGVLSIDSSMLLSLYIEQLERWNLAQEAVSKFNLVARENYKSEADYKIQVEKLSSKIRVLPPVKEDGKSRGGSRKYWTMSMEYYDEQKWRRALEYMNDEANKAVRQLLKVRFDTSLALEKQKRERDLEDLKVAISNVMADYDRTTADRLAYLKEQAGIARKLKLARSTIEAQSFNSMNGILTNVRTDNPFYLRGYEAIEKEIELLETRKNKKAFMPGLFELEQKKRSIEQDKTIERAEKLFALTPVMSNEFEAADAALLATEFNYKAKSKFLVLILSALLGGVVSVLLVLLENAIRSRKSA